MLSLFVPLDKLRLRGALTHISLNDKFSVNNNNYNTVEYCLGKLGLKIPSLVNKDMTMITKFFDGMSTEDSDTQLSLRVSQSINQASKNQIIN